MNDPWDVKSVRQSSQYVSCMKINGVPLLPPVLSKECRKEMQYYKLLAKEVEKRISVLQPYVVGSDTESEDKTDAPELPESENYELPQEEMQTSYNVNIDVPSPTNTPNSVENPVIDTPKHTPYNKITSKIVDDSLNSHKDNSPKFVIDLSLKINESGKDVLTTTDKSPSDMPERDYNCIKESIENTEKELITEVDSPSREKREVVNVSISYREPLSDPMSDFVMHQDGPSSLSSKSFTGSLNDLHSESLKDGSKLIRQRSYTLLKPSPQLLAHLEVQSISTGIEMHSISMSESLSNVGMTKKRRSWDLETAKVKWSSMATELKQKNVVSELNGVSKTQITRSTVKKSPMTPSRARSVMADRNRRNGHPPKTLQKSEPLPKTKKTPLISSPTNHTTVKELTSSTVNNLEPGLQNNLTTIVAECEDPATRIRELYEKIQKQQLMQMASLVEKQKREQLLLQQVFEEQNNLLFKQLKTICPKSPMETKEDLSDKHVEADRGPVSLSQLINHKSPDQSISDSPVSSTLTDTNNYINHCDNILKKSRDITGSIKKQQIKSRSQNGTKIQLPKTQPEGSRTRTHSPSQRSTLASRRLNYDTSASTDRECDPILTDRTNDTMADLNVTFPSDSEGNNYTNNNIINHLCGKEMKTGQSHSGPGTGMHSMFTHTDSAIRNMERAIQNSINSTNARVTKSLITSPPTAKQRAAATKIVAVAKGYLVRRLMRTHRVQTTVQTIKDALLCALQLHQEREGIRGADVDLHRRLIQQITAACYSLHDTFVASSPAERCAIIAADRGRRRSLASRQTPKSFKQTDIMSHSYSGAMSSRSKRSSSASAMTQSNYETFSGDKSSPLSERHMPSPRRRRPWR